MKYLHRQQMRGEIGVNGLAVEYAARRFEEYEEDVSTK
jgi:hypothetical protein